MSVTPHQVPHCARRFVPARASRLLAAACLLAAWGGAQPAHSAALLDVRIGKHQSYTRIVFDLDENVQHGLDRIETQRGAILLLKLDASARRRVIATDARFVRSVRVEPRGEGAIVRIEVTAADVQAKVFALRKPSRLVVDLSGAAAPTPGAVPGPAPSASAGPPPVAAEKIARPKLPPVATRGAVREAPTPPAPTPSADAPAQPAPGRETKARRPEPAAASFPAQPPPDARRGATPRPLPAPARATPIQTGAPAEDEAGGIRPIYLGAAVALVVVAFIALALRRVRGKGEPGERLAEEPPGSTWEAEVSASIEAGQLEGQDLGAGLVEGEPSAAPEPLTTQPIPAWDRLAGPESEPAGGEAAPQDPRVREVDARLQHLETRIEEVIEARDRLERQVSAQAEELRVQRAAIARAQRVLRSLARPEDATSESAPRDPNEGPPR